MRRRTLLLSTAGAGLGATGAAAAFVARSEPADALAPWRSPGLASRDPLIFVLSHAILAPNPHNRQPWSITLQGEDSALVHCDLDRRLPVTDPEDRQITIGFGCFLELAAIAATGTGHRLEIAAFPEGEPLPRLDARPIARLRLRPAPGIATDSLLAAIAARRSTKEPFDTGRAIPLAAIRQLAATAGDGVVVGAANAGPQAAAIRETAWRAFELEMRTPRTYRESVDLMRIGRREIEADPDGIDLGGAFFELLRLVGQLDRGQLADPRSTAFRQGLDAYRALFAASTGFLWIATTGNRRHDQLAAGRAYARANLTATALGMAMHPVSQALQEFPEMAPLAAAMNAAIGPADGQRLQMLARIGFGPAVAPSPRWPLEKRLRRT